MSYIEYVNAGINMALLACAYSIIGIYIVCVIIGMAKVIGGNNE